MKFSGVIIHCDNGGENIGPLKQVAKEAGIVNFKLTPHGSPQFNGVAERASAFIGDRAKTLLYDSKLTMSFKNKLWPFAQHDDQRRWGKFL